MNWLNEPGAWSVDSRSITATTEPHTDFWRKTHYGFVRDNGHFLWETVQGDFTAEAVVRGEYQALYDQAGLMLRASEASWLKCGIEYVGGRQQASVVVTRDFSDWSVFTLPDDLPQCWFRLQREGDALNVFYSLDGEIYELMRLAYLPAPETVQVGVMCASPEGPGFKVIFSDFKIVADS